MAVAGAKVPLFKDHFWHFQIKIRPWKNHEAGQHLTTGCWFLLDHCLVSIIFRLVNETRAIVLVQAGMQENQFASMIYHTGNIKNFTENHQGKSFFFFWRLKRDLSLNFCVCHKKRKSWSELNIVLLLFICKMHLIYCKVLKVLNFILFSSF